MVDQILNSTREKMRKALEVTATDLSSIRSGRASPVLVENLIIAAYGGSQRLKLTQLATITTTDARTLLIVPFDPSILAEIERGIISANVGLTPVIDGETIRISIPALSEERRLEYLKLARTKLEAGRVMIRQVRQEAMHDLKKAESEKQITQDEHESGEKLVQQLTDEMIAEIDAMGERKEQELLQV